jgi:hypothetical protein
MVFVNNRIRFFKNFGGVSQKIKLAILPLNLGVPSIPLKIKVVLVLEK